MPTISGTQNDFRRIRTGLPSLDILLGNPKTGEMGFPIRTITEIYGYPGHGKSTIAQFIAGKVCSLTGAEEVDVLDLEGAYDGTHFLSNLELSGFKGVANMLSLVDDNGKEFSHEDLLGTLLCGLKRANCGATILDSLGAIMSQAEVDNPIGSANWGKRPIIINQFMRKSMYYLRNDKPRVVLAVNHQYPAMGGRGHTTPGGEGKSFAAAIRLSIWKSETFGDGAFAVKIKAEKMRYGGVRPKLTATVVIIPGIGISPHLSVMIDALECGLLERSKAGVIKLDGKSLGRIGTLTQKAADWKFETFDPIMALADKIVLQEVDDEGV